MFFWNSLFQEPKHSLLSFRCSYVSVQVCILGKDGTPLQYSCLENPMDGGGQVHPWVRRIPWQRAGPSLGREDPLEDGGGQVPSLGQEDPLEEGRFIPGSGGSPKGGHGSPLQYSCLENPMDRGA